MINKRNRNPEDDFKIIGITVGDNCAVRLAKVLRKNYPYYFYPEYKLDKTDNFENFPKQKNKLYGSDINGFAIVGQNGSGKSTLIELLFMAINNVGRKLKIKEDLIPKMY
jgi:polynucleotide 5'-kinase involved in rRNA processing